MQISMTVVVPMAFCKNLSREWGRLSLEAEEMKRNFEEAAAGI